MHKAGAALLLFTALSFAHSRLPVAFEPNRGQAPAGIDFLTHGQGYVFSLRAARADLITRHSHLTTDLVGARRSASAVPESPLPGVVNYLYTSFTAIPTYGRVRYRGVYPGIDVVYYGGAPLEYDFVVAPRADARQIRLRYTGARGLRLDAAGDLLLETADGIVRQHRPVAYQQTATGRHEVLASYRLHGATVQLQLAPYDHSRALIVDPALSWATFVGFGNGDGGEAVALDSTGNVYTTGSTLTTFGDVDVFVAKLSPDGTKALFTAIFSTQSFPGSDNDFGHTIAVDSAGNVYVAGETSSSDFLADGTYIASGAQSGTPHVFISKLNATGQNLVYSHYVAANGADVAYGIAVDSAGNAFLTGATNSTNFPVTTGAAQSTRAGGVDGFLMKFDPNGTRVFATYLGGAGDDFANAVALDSSSNAFITGSTSSTNFKVTNGAFRSQSAGGADAFVAKFSPSGTLLFSTYLGGAGADSGNGIAVDSSGAAYVTGETASSDFPTASASQPATIAGNGDIFVAKLNPDGSSLAYAAFLGGGGEDSGNAIAVDAGGNAYITGQTTSTDFPLKDAFQATNLGTTNAVVAALDSTGANVIFSSYLGGDASAGTGGDSGSGIAVNCAAGVVIAGATTSKNFPVTAGTVGAAFNGGTSNAFLARIAAGGAAAIAAGGIVNSATSSAAPVAPGSLITIYGTSMALGSESAATVPLPPTLAGATVLVNGTAAPIVFASPSQINVQLPYEAGLGTGSATVTVPCGVSPAVSFPVAQVAPYIFTIGNGVAAVRNQDNSINGPNNPAKTGSFVTVYMTGIGPLDNSVPTGAAAPTNPLSRATLRNTATIAGFDANIQFLGLTPLAVGLAQANLVIPATLSPGAYPVVVTVGGFPSNAPTIYVQ